MSDSHSHHVTSLSMLFATFGALIFLTILTVVLSGPPFDFGRFDMVVVLTIAIAKASLVALIFMQLLYDKLLNGVILVGSLMFVILFLGITLMDSNQYQPDVKSFVRDDLIANPPAPVTPADDGTADEPAVPTEDPEAAAPSEEKPADEPTADEPPSEDPASDEPLVEEPAAEEPATETSAEPVDETETAEGDAGEAEDSDPASDEPSE